IGVLRRPVSITTFGHGARLEINSRELSAFEVALNRVFSQTLALSHSYNGSFLCPSSRCPCSEWSPLLSNAISDRSRALLKQRLGFRRLVSFVMMIIRNM